MARNSIFKHKKRNKKGMSEIVITVIIVALSLAAVIVVWGFVSNLIKKQISQSESCFGTFGKITINGQYTCYEELANNNFKLRLSLVVGDIKVDRLVVSVSSASAVKSFELSNIPQEVPNIVMYAGVNPQNVSLPGKNSGLTYNATGFTGKIDSIQIAPVVGGNMCEPSDSISEVENCALSA